MQNSGNWHVVMSQRALLPPSADTDTDTDTDTQHFSGICIVQSLGQKLPLENGCYIVPLMCESIKNY